MRRLALPIALVLALGSSSAALADSPVAVDCGNGSGFTAAVDSLTLTSLQASLDGVAANPTGVTCSLAVGTLDPTIGLSTTSSGGFVVGGGRFDRGPGPGPMQGCGLNFSISAHASPNGFNGTQNYTINNADGCGDLSLHGHVKANVTCLAIVGNRAQIKGVITEISGGFTTLASAGDTLETDVEDNGNPSGGIPDLIDVFPGTAGTNLVCAAPTTSPFFEVENGNITVHDR
ncbi:MAG TPA: hypothetical protein VEU77_09685 [Candidatus Acidoferrales bacterium]|nr:hypothetical protein [Candidatus Acidoferrales bacterium]